MDRMNHFYRLPKYLQWTLAWIMFILAMILTGYWMGHMNNVLLTFLFLFILAPFFQFLVSPFFTLTGAYTYLSPMLLVFGASDKKYDIHNGTSFDYLFVMRGIKPGRAWENKLLSYYLEGLLEIIRRIETKEIPKSIEIRGTSYFFSERTAKRMGFELKKVPSFEKFNLILNIIDLTWFYSLSRGRFALPKLNDVKTASTTGDRLVKQKPTILQIQAFLNNRIKTDPS